MHGVQNSRVSDTIRLATQNEINHAVMFACKGKDLDNFYGNNGYIHRPTPHKILLHMHFGLLVGFANYLI